MPKDRVALNRDRVVAAALALVDADGGGALTMRNLATQLHVEAMSLYHHVTNREDLLDGFADLLVITELPIASADEAWDDALRAFARGIRRAAQRHPEAFALVGLRPLRSEQALRPVLALIDRLEAAGVPPETTVTAYRLAAAYARGFALAEIAGLTLENPTDRASTSPALTDALNRSNDDIFEDGLRLIVLGARAEVSS